MNLPLSFRKWTRQRGVGLIEVMIGLTAGLVLVGVLTYFVLGSRQANRTHEDVSRMQESGRVALDVLGRAIRQAGARVDVSVPFEGGLLDPLTLTEGGVGVPGLPPPPDAITVRYEPPDGNDGEADCLGTKVTVADGHPVTFVFTVDTATNTLRCTNETNAPPVVVMDNVENMQITYGIKIKDDPNGAIETYEDATAVADSHQVAAVRVSLLVRGPTRKVATNSTQTYTYNGAMVTNFDGFLRQVYSSAFTVRNQAK